MEVITTHINADFDSLASMVAAQKLYPKAKLVFPGSQEENLRQFLSLSSYKIAHYRLKQLDMERIQRLILVDTRLAERIGSLAQVAGKAGVEIHIYDHHPRHPKDLHGQVEVVRETGATTTLLVEVLQQKGIQVSAPEATIFALGIYEDTGLLTYRSTTEDDLKAAAQVRAWGADLKVISTFINRDLSAQQIFLLNELINNAESYMVSDVEVVISSISIDKYSGDIAVLAHKLRDIENIDVLFVLARLGGRVHVVARSNLDLVNVGDVAVELGGGGHPTAASATIKELTLAQTKDRLMEILKRHIIPYRTARNFMTSPAKYISIQRTISQAKEMLVRYGINHLPVVDEKGKLAGLVSRQTVDKAISHKMEDSPLAECMVSDISWISPQAEPTTVRQLMLERHQPLLPVLDNERLVGVITRSDLLRMLHEDLGRRPQPIYPHRDTHLERKNLISLLRERLPERVQHALKLAGMIADELGYSAYVVGGMVRDLLLRVDNLDVDIVVEQDGIRFAKALAKRVGGRYKAHKKFATAVVVFPDGFKIDVATARTEYYKHPAALPIVEQSSIKQDLYRRDFSINSLAIQLNQCDFGRLIDFFGGQQDLKNGVIRVLHSLSFVEDPSRVFRAIRFEQRFNFRIGKYTLNMIQHAVQRRLCDKLAGTRLWQELMMIFAEVEPVKSIIRMGELNLLQFIHPALKLDNKLIQLCRNTHTMIDWYNLLFLERQIEGWLVYLLSLTDQLGDDEAAGVWQRMNLGERHVNLLNKARQQTPEILNELHRRDRRTPSQVFRLLEGISPEALLYVMTKTPSEEIKRIISFYLTKLQHEAPEIGGKELKQLGLKPGPQFKKILDAVLDAKLDGKLKNRKAELDFVKTVFGTVEPGGSQKLPAPE
jgi:tRNA nucleotidyltransferase (CCA-adding enzyme)